jgi:peptidoglycan/xylan/chitin deacetylase (PgdA/CDA1 family)
MNRLIVTTSWDDGSILDLRLAEMLKKYGIKATFYVPKSYPHTLLRKEDTIAIDKEFEVGAHGLNHEDLTAIPLEEARKEIEGSKAHLEDLLGHSISMFSYPYGKFNAGIKKLVRSCGFAGARTTIPGDFDFSPDPFGWHVTQYASGEESPFVTLRVWRKFRIPIKILFNWEAKAKLLFDMALQKGGVYHLWGHSWQLERDHEWDKLERVLSYLSNKDGVYYATNGEAIAGIVYQQGGAET